MKTLRFGSLGAETIALQKQLKALGFDPGAIDGDFGRKTDDAVRQFQAQAGLTVDGIVGATTRAAIAARLAISPALGASPRTPSPARPAIARLEDLAARRQAIALSALASDRHLTAQLQRQLQQVGTYCGEIDGQFDGTVRAALQDFGELLGSPIVDCLDWPQTQALLQPAALTCARWQQARDRERLHQTFEALQQQRVKQGKATGERLTFLDRGAGRMEWGFVPDVGRFADILALPVDEEGEAGLGTAPPYPGRGVVPAIASQGLDFLHPDIQQACVCVGGMAGGQWRSRWYGREALTNEQFWSATKFFPLLYAICRANQVDPNLSLDDAIVLDLSLEGNRGKFPFAELARKIFTYEDTTLATSNAIALTFKLLATPTDLERWCAQLTGNAGLAFTGRYGEPPLMAKPELLHRSTRKVLLTSPGVMHQGSNLVSAYDLTRLLTLVGWHHRLPLGARLPGAQWHSLRLLVSAMGMDTARYVDAAIVALGLQPVLQQPVILSKLGFGYSDRQRTELTYTALVDAIVTRPGARPQRLAVGMALKGVKRREDGDRDLEAYDLDVRMAAEVTEILRRVVAGELGRG